MASKVDIANMALSRGGNSRVIANLDTDPSNEAVQCRIWYDQCRQFALADADWNCARRRSALAVATSTPPADIWEYAYVYPNNCLIVRQLVTPSQRFPRKDQKIPYEVANDGTNKVIYTNLVDAIAIWTLDLTDTTKFTPGLVSAIAYLLTSEVAIPLSLKPDMAAQARDGYRIMIDYARRMNAMEGEAGVEPESLYFAERNA